MFTMSDSKRLTRHRNALTVVAKVTTTPLNTDGAHLKLIPPPIHTMSEASDTLPITN